MMQAMDEMTGRWFWTRSVIPSLTALVAVLASTTALAQPEEVLAEARDDYTLTCAACHGPTGAGDGPMAEILIVPPADLSAIARNNDGVFPFWRVYEIIAGERQVKGHDTFQMPGGKARFERDEAKPGYLPAYVRVLLLAHYVEALQKP